MTDASTLSYAPPGFDWPCCPQAEAVVEDYLMKFLAGHVFAARLAKRMGAETSTRFFDWVDYLEVPPDPADAGRIQEAGYVQEEVEAPAGWTVFWHPHAQLPRIVVREDLQAPGAAIHVDSICDFQVAHGLSQPIQGAPGSSYRILRLPEGPSVLSVVERRAYAGYVPDERPRAEAYLRALERWCTRPRAFEPEAEVAGMAETLALAEGLVEDLGTGRAACVFLDGERRYWQARNRAGRFQKWRQDGLGLGWANHDHHTFRSSGRHFPALIRILEALGFRRRERFYAGAEAGWGAQVMEQPEARLVVFADVDLAQTETQIDFTRVAPSELGRPGTVGLWCALHGESMLQAGMHHLEAQFNFEDLRAALKGAGHGMMTPFSDFPFLRQAFTEGEPWPVAESRLRRARDAGWIDEGSVSRFRTAGAVGSHLENLQRREGFKGFNQESVSAIIRDVHPERQAAQK